jgi:hypothetical protein
MRRFTYVALVVGILCALITSDLHAQTPGPDSSSQQDALNSAKSYYYASLGKESPLFNGEEYYPTDPIIKGNAFFLEINSFTNGSVVYCGITFRNVPLMYDVFGDQLVVLLYNKFSEYTLIKDKVSSFDLNGHHIINIDSLALPANAAIKAGFYDEVYKGKMQALVKRSKNIQTTSSTSTLESYFNASIDYYLKKNNVYYTVNSKGELLDVLKDRKKDIQQFIRTQQLNYRKDPVEALAKIAAYYDQITN